MDNKYDILRDDIMISKIGLSKAEAEWAIKTSRKYCVWIANQLKKYGSGGNIKHNIKKVISWKKDNPAVNLNAYDLTTALQQSKNDSDFRQDAGSLENKKVVVSCKDGKYKWVELTSRKDCVEEGKFMKHCLKTIPNDYLGHGAQLFSLRDIYNKPVLTLQIRNGDLTEYSSTSNKLPDSKYDAYFEELEKWLGLEIDGDSKLRFGIFGKLKASTAYSILGLFEDDCRDGHLDYEVARKLVRRLSEEAKKQGLKVNISPVVIDQIEEEHGDEGSYDENGSLIC